MAWGGQMARTGGGLLAAALGLALSAAPVQACTPAPFTQTGNVKREACSNINYLDEYDSEGLTKAEDIGATLVLQTFVTGNACYAEVSAIIIDCTAKKAVIFGPTSYGAAQGDGPTAMSKVLDQVNAAFTRGKPMNLTQILALAKGKFAMATTVSIKNRIGLSNDASAPVSSYNLGCGCKLLYPHTVGASQ